MDRQVLDEVPDPANPAKGMKPTDTLLVLFTKPKHVK
jgi:hypothetical protein